MPCVKIMMSHDGDINAARVILKQAGEQLGVESTESSCRLRPTVRVAGSLKHGDVQG